MVQTVRMGPTLGLIAQVLLLATLAGAVGLGAAGWVAGVTFGGVMWAALTRGLRRAGTGAFGPANWVTLIRATLVGCVAALAAASLQGGGAVNVLVPITVVALVLDAVDGWVARRTGSASPLGARFDMEVDAFLILVLSVFVAPSMGAWVLTIGAMRYVFVAAGWVLPWLPGPLPPRRWRKFVAAVQGIVLACASADVFAVPVILAAVVGALILLVESFGRDIRWRWRHRLVESRPAGVPAIGLPASGPLEPDRADSASPPRVVSVV